MGVLELQKLETEFSASTFDNEAKSCSSCNADSCHLRGGDFDSQLSEFDINWVNE